MLSIELLVVTRIEVVGLGSYLGLLNMETCCRVGGGRTWLDELVPRYLVESLISLQF